MRVPSRASAAASRRLSQRAPGSARTRSSCTAVALPRPACPSVAARGVGDERLAAPAGEEAMDDVSVRALLEHRQTKLRGADRDMALMGRAALIGAAEALDLMHHRGAARLRHPKQGA